MIRRAPRSTLCPYTALVRSRLVERTGRLGGALRLVAALPGRARFADLADWLTGEVARLGVRVDLGTAAEGGDVVATGDRKSTRLNSSHANISYAVFCLKKK